jgi:hypothetical protein
LATNGHTDDVAYGHSWDLHHLPTRQTLCRIGQTGELAGERLTVELAAVRQFGDPVHQRLFKRRVLAQYHLHQYDELQSETRRGGGG